MPPEEKKTHGKLGLIAVLAIIAVVFILLNYQEVEIKFVVGTTTAPLIFALALSTLLGFVVGYLAGRFGDHDRRKNRD